MVEATSAKVYLSLTPSGAVTRDLDYVVIAAAAARTMEVTVCAHCTDEQSLTMLSSITAGGEPMYKQFQIRREHMKMCSDVS